MCVGAIPVPRITTNKSTPSKNNAFMPILALKTIQNTP